jgi:hypothetical protein
MDLEIRRSIYLQTNRKGLHGGRRYISRARHGGRHYISRARHRGPGVGVELLEERRERRPGRGRCRCSGRRCAGPGPRSSLLKFDSWLRARDR